MHRTSLPLPIVVVGHVDHGKSTLIGRLLHETGALADGKLEAIREMSRKRAMPFEWSFVLDALQAERDQGITIDSTQLRFRTRKREYVIIDAPGHKEFLRNMVTGAAQAEAALLVVDATEGVREQSRRHAFLLQLLGVTQIAVVVNKVDLVGYGEQAFARVAAEIARYLAGLGLKPASVIPVSGREGDNIAAVSPGTPWYRGPSVLDQLDAFELNSGTADRALRLPVQDVYKFDHRRIVAGRIESGRLKVGDRLIFAPSGKSAHIASIEGWNRHAPQISAVAGQSIAITLDDDIFVERGQIASRAGALPGVFHDLPVRLFWLGRKPLVAGQRLKLRLATAEHWVNVTRIERVLDLDRITWHDGEDVPPNGIADVVLHSRSAIVADAFADIADTGRAVLMDGYEIVAGATVRRSAAEEQAAARNITAVAHAVQREERERANGHRGGVLWLTGLSGAGKSTLAMALERRLFDRGWQAYVIDGDNLRRGLNADLGFTPEERSENIRRAAAAAALFAEAGTLTIAALISPSEADRARAKSLGGEGFREVYVKADLATCEARDPKGLYRRARRGEIPAFTGVSAPYDEPASPDLVVDTSAAGIERCLEQLTEFVAREFAAPSERAVSAGL